MLQGSIQCSMCIKEIMEATWGLENLGVGDGWYLFRPRSLAGPAGDLRVFSAIRTVFSTELQDVALQLQLTHQNLGPKHTTLPEAYQSCHSCIAAPSGAAG